MNLWVASLSAEGLAMTYKIVIKSLWVKTEKLKTKAETLRTLSSVWLYE
jgi:hypothetical protein